ncbi:MAG: hypothetical protein QGI88_13500 [SAR202 cluster bacterium]|nr:hypothetical protein [SAR202 cluster bacterium]MDP7534774.1 hypothetical protein [SAR202 cluster bacterium]
MKSIAMIVVCVAAFALLGCSSSDEGASDAATPPESLSAAALGPSGGSPATQGSQSPRVAKTEQIPSAEATDESTDSSDDAEPTQTPVIPPIASQSGGPVTSSISGGNSPSQGSTGTNENEKETPGTGPNAQLGSGLLVQAPESEQKQKKPVELVIGEHYEGGTLVNVSALDITFEIPMEWRGGLAADTGVMLLRSDVHEGFILSTSQQGTNASEVAAMLGQAFPLDATTILMPNGLPQLEEDGWVSGRYTGADGFNALAGYAMALVDPSGRGILYVVAGPEDEADYYNDVMANTETGSSVAGGVTDSAQLQIGDDSPLVRQWTQHLAGRLMRYMSTSGGSEVGSSMRRDLYICRDGRFFYQEEGLVAVDVPGASTLSGGQRDDQGQWRILTVGA